MGKRSEMADQQKQLPTLGHLTSSQVPAVCEKNIFHLFRFAQAVENLTCLHSQAIQNGGVQRT